VLSRTDGSVTELVANGGALLADWRSPSEILELFTLSTFAESVELLAWSRSETSNDS
jgi:hypothetical protein